MRTRIRAASVPILVVTLFATAPHAQEWRGMGRVAGKVVDESGTPLEGVTVKAMLARAENRGPESKSNRRGEWAVAGIAHGEWAIDFLKEGYEPKNISVTVSETSRIPPMDVVMKKAVRAVDHNQAIHTDLTRAAEMVKAKEFAKARAVYEELSAKYPEAARQFEPLIARTYYGEGNKAKALEHLRSAAAKDPNNVEVKVLLGNTLIETGAGAEGRQVLESIDEARIADPTVYLNVAIAMINEGRHADAVTWVDKAIARFPTHPDAYYYRGIARVSLAKTAEAKADLEKFVSMAPSDAPELPTAKKILESLK